MGLQAAVCLKQKVRSNAWCTMIGEVQRRLGALGEWHKYSGRCVMNRVIGAKRHFKSAFCFYVLLRIRLCFFNVLEVEKNKQGCNLALESCCLQGLCGTFTIEQLHLDWFRGKPSSAMVLWSSLAGSFCSLWTSASFSCLFDLGLGIPLELWLP